MRSQIVRQIGFLLVVSLLFASCTDTNDSSFIGGREEHTSIENSLVSENPSSITAASPRFYSLNDVTWRSVRDGIPYDEVSNQQLIWTGSDGTREIIVEDIGALLISATRMNVVGTYSIVFEDQAQSTIFLKGVGGRGKDRNYLFLLKFDTSSKKVVETTLDSLFSEANGDLIQLGNSSQFLWAPSMDRGAATKGRIIMLLDLSNETAMTILTLSEGETLRGSDPCDPFSHITDITLSPTGNLRYAVYSRKMLQEANALCQHPIPHEEQQKNANAAFIEYRTLNLIPMPSSFSTTSLPWIQR